VSAPIAILGSGMASLGAAHRLRQEGAPYVMFDRGTHPGGHTKTYEYPDGWTFDDGPHVSFTEDERIQGILAEQIGGDYQAVPTAVNNYWRGYWIKHPAQINLHGLPTDLVVDCIRDFVAATADPDPAIRNYEDWLYAAYGRTFADTFPMGYTRKVHTTNARNLTTDWMGPRMYRPTLDEVLRGALTPSTPEVHYIDRFRYPTHGGFYSYLRPIHEASDLRMDHEVVRISPSERTIAFANGRVEPYGGVVSSIPLPALVPMIEGAPPEVVEAASRLAATQCVIVNIGFDRVEESGNSWTYFYDEDLTITRLSYPHRYSRNAVPEGCSAFQCEIYFSDKYRPLTVTPESLIDTAIQDLRTCGLLLPSDRILLRDAKLSPYAGIIFDHDRPPALALINDYLDSVGIRSAGRFGEWAYLWTDHSFISGERAAQEVLDGRRIAAPAPAAGV
jgi:protoporphyrinogen oxidase